MNMKFAAAGLALIMFTSACGDSSDTETVIAQDDSVSVDNTGDSAQTSPGSDSLAVPANATDFNGMTKDDAIAKAEAEDREWRISSEDGEVFALTEDFHPGRVTFDISDGVITNSFIEVVITESEMVVEPNEDGTEDDAPSDFVLALIGLSKDEAIAILEDDDRPWRIGHEDGEDFALTMDYLEERITFTIIDGIVVDAENG